MTTGKGSRTFCNVWGEAGSWSAFFWWQSVFDWAQAGWVTVLGHLPAKNTNDHVLIPSLLEPDPSQPPPFNATDIPLFPRVVSLILWKVDSSEAADHVVLNSTLTQNNYYWISFTCHFIIKLPVNFQLCFEHSKKNDTVLFTLTLKSLGSVIFFFLFFYA